MNKRVAERKPRERSTVCTMLATNSFCIKGRNAYVRDLETGDVFVKYRSVLFRGEKPFLEIMFCAGVLEQTLEQTLNPKTETDCLFFRKSHWSNFLYKK